MLSPLIYPPAHPSAAAASDANNNRTLGQSVSIASFAPSSASFAPSFSSFAPSASQHSLPSTTTHLPRGHLTLQDRLAVDRLVAHHAALRNAAPSIHSRISNPAHSTAARNHLSAVTRNHERKRREIDEKNQRMVTKITETIIKGTSPYTPQHLRKGAAATSQPFIHKSLNSTRRKQEAARIAEDNLKLAHRIVTKKAEIGSKKEFEKHAAKHDRLLGRISRFVEVPGMMNQNGIMVNPQMVQYAGMTQEQLMQFAAASGQINGGAGSGGSGEMTEQEQQQQALMWMQQQQWQQMQQVQQQQQYQQQSSFQPSPPPHPHPHSSASSSATSGALLQPLQDADKRAARLNKKMLASAKEQYGVSERAKNGNLLKPLLRHEREASSDAKEEQKQQEEEDKKPSHAQVTDDASNELPSDATTQQDEVAS